MTTLTEIELAVKQLPKQDLRQFAEWFQQYLEAEWDKQIEADAAAGRLNTLIASAEADIEAGRVKELDEVIHNS